MTLKQFCDTWANRWQIRIKCCKETFLNFWAYWKGRVWGNSFSLSLSLSVPSSPPSRHYHLHVKVSEYGRNICLDVALKSPCSDLHHGGNATRATLRLLALAKYTTETTCNTISVILFVQSQSPLPTTSFYCLCHTDTTTHAPQNYASERSKRKGLWFFHGFWSELRANRGQNLEN